MKTELQRRTHDSIPEQGRYLRSVLDGHFRYYGVPGNSNRLAAFRLHVLKLWWRSLMRRSQRVDCRGNGWRVTPGGSTLTPRIHHPWP